MKYLIEAEVDGELRLETPNGVVTIDYADVRYEFRSDDTKRVSVIAVIVAVRLIRFRGHFPKGG